jgi:hypothetical protein
MKSWTDTQQKKMPSKCLLHISSADICISHLQHKIVLKVFEVMNEAVIDVGWYSHNYYP